MLFDLSSVGARTLTNRYIDAPCPECGPSRRSPTNRARKVLRIWPMAPGKHSYCCIRCGARGVTSDPIPAALDTGERGQTGASDRSRAARTLWQRSAPIMGTPAERYLREGRGYRGPLPATLRYLAPNEGHPHAMIAAFGACPGSDYGELNLPHDPVAIHLTRLAPDGLARIDKRMLGTVSGKPIVLAPPNDGLGLVIAEGIEDALSLHEATGLGAWAAGSAGHLAKLAPGVPAYVEVVTLAEDADEPGRRACSQLARDLAGCGIDVRILSFAEPAT